MESILATSRAGSNAGADESITTRVVCVRGDDGVGASPRRRTANPDEDLAVMRVGPSDSAVRFRFLAGRWPDPGELDCLRRRQAATPALRRRPFVDAIAELIQGTVPTGGKVGA